MRVRPPLMLPHLLDSMLREAEAYRGAGLTCCADAIYVAIRVCITSFLERAERQVSVRTAAEMTGRSPAHIRRLMRSGYLSRFGGDGEPLRTRLCDLVYGREHAERYLATVRAYQRAAEKL